jgi:hypothetical protein
MITNGQVQRPSVVARHGQTNDQKEVYKSCDHREVLVGDVRALSKK